jgi:exodeoxyribonuclease-5
MQSETFPPVDEQPATLPEASPDPKPLNDQQQLALSAMIEFIQDAEFSPDNWCFALKGYAGTGKTFLMKKIADMAARSKMTLAFTAPTNKAAKVLKAVVGEACTIYSLLGLRIDTTGELKTIVGGEKTDLTGFDLVFVDESSMINENLRQAIYKASMESGCKFIFMGDIAQLPPVNEGESPVWKLECPSAELTKVMRHDNQILKLVTQIREEVFKLCPTFNFKSDNDGTEGVWKLAKNEFAQKIYELAARGSFADGAKFKITAWRNVKVAEYNNLVRKAIYGADAVEGFYLPGDRIIAAAPCMRGETTLLATDEEALVESVVQASHPTNPSYLCLELKCRTENNQIIRLQVLHPRSRQGFENDCQALGHQAKSNPKLWRRFWSLKETFHEVKYAYAITTHRAQGSTYENVFVDYLDILMNRNRKEAFQSLYVACSRPTTRLYLA